MEKLFFPIASHAVDVTVSPSNSNQVPRTHFNLPPSLSPSSDGLHFQSILPSKVFFFQLYSSLVLKHPGGWTIYWPGMESLCLTAQSHYSSSTSSTLLDQAIIFSYKMGTVIPCVSRFSGFSSPMG